jgi:hypothetical protein
VKPVALVSMPTMSTRFPSFQLALLKPILEEAGFEVRPMSLFLRFAERLGPALNEALADVYPCMVGEWIWSTAAFGPGGNADEYFRVYESNLRAICTRAGCTIADLQHVRDVEAIEFLDEMVEEVDWSSFGVVGLSITFQQMAASLALAKALKRRHPELPVILGGATFEDDIAREVMTRNPEVDLVHCGDADVSLPELVSRLYAGNSLEGLRGVMWRDDGEIVYEGRAPNFADLDRSPVPDFDEYFATRREGRPARGDAADRDRPRLLVRHEEPLRVLRSQPRGHGLPAQEPRAGPGDARAALHPVRHPLLQRDRQHPGAGLHVAAVRPPRRRAQRPAAALRDPARRSTARSCATCGAAAWCRCSRASRASAPTSSSSCART